MKRISFIFLVLVSGSCEKIMHEQYLQIAQIHTEEEMNTALTGAYSALSYYFNYDYVYYDRGSGVIPKTFADDFSLAPYFESPSGYRFNLYAYGLRPDIENSIWEKLYKVVACANNIICQLENEQNLNIDLFLFNKEIFGLAR